MNPAWLGVIIPLAIAAGTAMSQWLIQRRIAGGHVRTSEAEILWQQSQKIMETMQRDKERAEDQRDRLLDLQQTQIMPALEAITQSEAHILGILTELVGQAERGVGR